MKAHSLTQLAPQLTPLIGEDTTVVSTQNGIPWWYCPLERVDPGGIIAASIDPARVVGSIVYLGTEVVEPGVIRHTDGNRISLGEPDGTRSGALPGHRRGAHPGGSAVPGHHAISARKSGSSCWAMWRSIRSAP